MKFTVLIPTASNGAVIRNAIESVLAQRADFEVFLVGDGAPGETRAIMDEYRQRDDRIRVFNFDKGERHGEAWRHNVLQQADSDAVCYLSDDDFWFVDHLHTMAELLETFDFAHTRQANVLPNFTLNAYSRDLADADLRARLLVERCNFFGLSVVGHRLAAYHRLDEGWAPAPLDIATDFHMWRKWLAKDGMRFCSSRRITGLHMARIYRAHQNADACNNETSFWRQTFEDPCMVAALRLLAPEDESFIPLHTIAAGGRQARLTLAKQEARQDD